MLVSRDAGLTAKYEEAITGAALVIPFDARAAKLYAALRVDPSIGAPDAIQLACAAAASVDLFLTNDERLSAKHVDGIQFIVSRSRALL